MAASINRVFLALKMQKTTQSMIVLLVFAVGAIGGLWFYLQPGGASDTLAEANADLAQIGRNLDALEGDASKMASAVESPLGAGKAALHPDGEGSSMVFTGLSREKCREVLPRLLRNSGHIHSTVFLNGFPVNAVHGCRAMDNRIVVGI